MRNPFRNLTVKVPAGDQEMALQPAEGTPSKRSIFDLETCSRSPQSADSSEGVEEVLAALRNGATGETLALLDELRNPSARNWLQKTGVLAISLLLFFSLGLLKWSLADIAILIIVLVVHECGHYFLMRRFGYSDLQMFFLPFVGAVISGWPGKASGYQRTLVALAGPVPGIVLGVVVGIVFLITGQPVAGRVALVLLALNAFNLLPVLPLDGGHVLEETLFCRNRWLEAGFHLTAGVLLAAMAIFVRQPFLGVLAFFMIAAVPGALRTSAIAARLKEAGEAPDVGSPSEATLAFLVRVSTEIQQAVPNPLKPPAFLALVVTVLQKLNRRPPGAGATVGLLAAYGAAFVLAVFGAALVVAGHAASGDFKPVAGDDTPWSTGPSTRRTPDMRSVYSAGVEAYRRGDYPSAIETWQGLVRTEPAHAEAWNALGLAYMQMGRWAEAASAVREQLTVTPAHREAWGNLAWALQHLNEADQAIAAYRKQIALEPRDQWAHRRLGMLLLGRRQWSEAATELREASSITPSDFQIDVALGRACLKVGDVRGAIEAFERAKKPNSFGLTSELAQYLSEEGVGLDRADSWAREAIAGAAAESLNLHIDTLTMADTRRSWALSWGWYALGLGAYQRGDLRTAEHYISAAHSVRASPQIVRDLGRVVEKGGRREAAQLYAEALSLGADESARSALESAGVRERSLHDLVERARQSRSAARTVSLGKGELPGGAATVLILLTNGTRGAQVRPIYPDPNIEVLLARARRATYPVRFPDSAPAQIAGSGEVRCDGGSRECSLVLALGKE